MNKNNNKYYILFILSTLGNLLKTKVSFKHEGSIFPAILELGKKYNINIAVLTNKKIDVICNFDNIPLEDVLNMVLKNEVSYHLKNNFIIICDKKKVRKEYFLNTYISGQQWEEVEKFLNNLKDKLEIFYSINKVNNTILIEADEYLLKEINIYIQNFIKFLSEQVEIECRIINFIKSKEINTGIIWKKILKYLQIFLQNPLDLLQTLDNIDDILDLFNIYGKTNDLYHIRLLIKNHQEIVFEDKNEFYVENYQKTLVESSASYILPNNLKKNKESFLLPNHYLNETKSFKTGTYLSIIPIINKNKVDICLKYSKSSPNKKVNNKIPEINTNCFNTIITTYINRTVVITGLKNNYMDEENNDNILYKILSYLFYYKKRKEKKCEMIFLIKIKEPQKLKVL